MIRLEALIRSDKLWTIAEIFATKGQTTRRAFRQSRVRKNRSNHQRWPRRGASCHVFIKLTPDFVVEKPQPKFKPHRRLNLHFQRKQRLLSIINSLIDSKN